MNDIRTRFDKTEINELYKALTTAVPALAYMESHDLEGRTPEAVTSESGRYEGSSGTMHPIFDRLGSADPGSLPNNCCTGRYTSDGVRVPYASELGNEEPPRLVLNAKGQVELRSTAPAATPAPEPKITVEIIYRDNAKIIKVLMTPRRLRLIFPRAVQHQSELLQIVPQFKAFAAKAWLAISEHGWPENGVVNGKMPGPSVLMLFAAGKRFAMALEDRMLFHDQVPEAPAAPETDSLVKVASMDEIKALNASDVSQVEHEIQALGK